MSQPPSPYERSYSFTDNSTANPTSQQPGQKIDQELNAARTAINATQSRLAEVQADDGKVRNSALNLQTIAEAVEPLLTTAPITAVNNAGAAQVSAVNTAGTTQVANVNAAAASGVASLNSVLTGTNATTALGAAASASASATSASNSASAALSHRNQAYTYVNGANDSRVAAEQAAANANFSAVAAANNYAGASIYATNASNSATQANGYAADAEASKMAALQAKADAEAAANTAQSIVDNGSAQIIADVQPFIDEAAASATSAHNSANDALAYKTQAAASASTASSMASNAAAYASNASSSASSAAASASAAATFNPANFAPISHTHSIANVTGLQTALDGKVPEAPSNGNQYARINGGWSIVTAGLGDAPSNSLYYCRWNGGWVNFDPTSKPADALTQDQAYAVSNASYKNYAGSVIGTLSTGSGTLTFTDTNANDGKYVQLNAGSNFNLVDNGSYWSLEVPTFANTGNGYFVEDLVSYVSGQIVTLSASTTASLYADQTDNFVGNSVTMYKQDVGIGSGDRLLIKAGLLNYLQESAIVGGNNPNTVPTYNGVGVVWGQPWTGFGYVTSSALAGYASKSADNTYTGKQTFSASTTTRATLTIPHGTAPTTPTNGDVWSTTSGLFMRQNGTTQQFVDIGSTQTLTGAKTFSGTFVVSATTSSLGTSTTSNNTTNVGTGAVGSAANKFVNIATGGTAGSATTTVIGTSSGGTNSITINGPTTMNGTVTHPAGAKVTVSHSASAAGLNIGPVATAPTTPASGDVWHDISTGVNQIMGYANGVRGAMTACRAFVNFNGTGTVAIRAGFNVSSITDNGVGDYTVNFGVAMPDANYTVAATRGSQPSTGFIVIDPTGLVAPTTSAVRIGCVNAGNTAFQDTTYNYVAIYR